MKYISIFLLGILIIIGGCSDKKSDIQYDKIHIPKIEKSNVDNVINNLKKDGYRERINCFNEKCFYKGTQYTSIYYPLLNGSLIINNGLNIIGDIYYVISMSGGILSYNNDFSIKIPGEAEYLSIEYDNKTDKILSSIYLPDIQIIGGASLNINLWNKKNCNTYDIDKFKLYYDIHYQEALRKGFTYKISKDLNGKEVILVYNKQCYSHEEMFPKCNYDTPWIVNICLPVNDKVYDIYMPANSKKDIENQIKSIKIL